MIRRLLAKIGMKSEGEAEPHPLTKFGLSMLPFADAASPGLPLKRLLRLSLFQVSVGMATVILLGALNRVMIVELGVAASLVAAMAALPVLIAPFRALVGFRSDTFRSALGWKRIPYLWFGSLWQFGGLSIMPFALLVLSGDQVMGPSWAGHVGAAAAFAMTGIGLHMTQTAGLALAADQADEAHRPRVVALLYVMLLAGMAVSALVLGWLLRDFSSLRLIQVVQGSAVATLLLNIIALWKQEKLVPMDRAAREAPRPKFSDAWRDYAAGGRAGRLLAVTALGACAFSMQDILLEPYGGQVLGLSVSATTSLTALWALGALAGFGLASRWMRGRLGACGVAARGLAVGVLAFSMVIFSYPTGLDALFFAGAAMIGLGVGLFSVATLTEAMGLAAEGGAGLALGAWGAAQATAAALGIAFGGVLRDLVGQVALSGALGDALASPATGYAAVYHLEIVLLFVTLIVLGPLAGRRRGARRDARIGLAEFPT